MPTLYTRRLHHLGRVRGSAAIIVGAALCLPLTAATDDRRAPADPCADLKTAVREARSAEDLELRVQRLQPSQPLLGQCAPQLERAVSDQLRTSASQRSEQRLQQRVAASGALQVTQPMELRVNQQRIEQARSASRSRASALEIDTRAHVAGSDELGGEDWTPSQGTVEQHMQVAPGTLQITTVTPSTIVPGADFIIEGSGFGTQGAGGSQRVRLQLQGMSFAAIINSWNDTWISAYLHPDPDFQGEFFGNTVLGVQGVTASSSATLQVSTGSSQATRTVAFEPLLESRVMRARACKTVVFVPVNESKVLFNNLGSTQNGWTVEEWWTDGSGGQCDIGGPPAPQLNGSNVATELLLSSGWAMGLNAVKCEVNIRLVGPLGTSPGYGMQHFQIPNCEWL